MRLVLAKNKGNSRGGGEGNHTLQHLTHSWSPLTNRIPIDNIATIIPASPM